MQQCVSAPLTLEVYEHGMGECNVFTMMYGGQDPLRRLKPKYLPIGGSYQHNIQIVNKNFATLHDMQTKVSADLAHQNTDIRAVNASNEGLKASVASTNQEIQTLKSELSVARAELKWCIASNESLRADIKCLQLNIQQMSSGMADLKTQIVRVFQFLPEFIRHVSANFLKLLVSMKSSIVLEEIPMLSVA